MITATAPIRALQQRRSALSNHFVPLLLVLEGDRYVPTRPATPPNPLLFAFSPELVYRPRFSLRYPQPPPITTTNDHRRTPTLETRPAPRLAALPLATRSLSVHPPSRLLRSPLLSFPLAALLLLAEITLAIRRNSPLKISSAPLCVIKAVLTAQRRSNETRDRILPAVRLTCLAAN